MLSGKSCLAPTKNLYPGFEGTTAQIHGLPLPAEDPNSRSPHRSARVVVAAQDAVAAFDGASVAFWESGVVMASTVGLTEIDPGMREEYAVSTLRRSRFCSSSVTS